MNIFETESNKKKFISEIKVEKILNCTNNLFFKPLILNILTYVRFVMTWWPNFAGHMIMPIFNDSEDEGVFGV